MPKTFSNHGQCPRTPRRLGLGPSTFLHLDFQFVLARRLHNFWFIFCSGFPDSVFFLPGSALHGLFIFAYTYQNIGRTHIVLPGCLHRALRYRSRVNWGAGTLIPPLHCLSFANTKAKEDNMAEGTELRKVDEAAIP